VAALLRVVEVMEDDQPAAPILADVDAHQAPGRDLER
jgi:hypothetical protein